MTNPQPPTLPPAAGRPGFVPTGNPGSQSGPVPTVHQPQAATGAGPSLPPAPSGKRGNALTSKPIIGVAALVAGLALGAGAAGGGGGNGTAGTVAAVPAPTVTVTTTTTATATPEPSETPTAEPVPEVSQEATPEPTETVEAPEPVKKSYKALTSRKFKQLAKDPDSYLGKTYIIYGEVTQFDAATGTDTFRANIGPKKLKISYGWVDYSQNSMLVGDEDKLKKLVEGDCFKAKVTVLGSYSYDTQAGGNTTVPLFQVDSFSVYGSTD